MTSQAHFILIRGLLREARHWGGFTRQLQQLFPGAHFIAPDIPGNGRLHQLTSPGTVAAMTEALRNQISQRQNLKLIALSMGGMIAIDWMSRYPEEVVAAVLINTSARPLSPFYHRLRWTAYPCVIKMLFHSATQREADILALTSNQYSHDYSLLKLWQQWQQQYPVSNVSARNQFLAAVRFSVSTRPLQPVLVVASRTDRLVDYRCSLKLAQDWQVQYIQHATAGHDLPLDDPGWLALVIRQWVDVKNAEKVSISK